MHDAFKAFRDELHRRCSPLTVRRYGEVLRDLRDFTGTTAPSELASDTLIRFALAPRKDGRTRAPAGVNLRLAVLKSAFGYLHADGLIPTNPAARLHGVREPHRAPRHLTLTETSRLLRHVAQRPSQNRMRDLVMVVAFWQVGLRVSEFARLAWAQVDLEHGYLRDVLVKRGDRRDVKLNDETIRTLLAYRRGAADDAPVFARRDGRALSVRAIQARFATWRAELGWTGPLHPHLLRRTYATDLHAQGADVPTIADLLGHHGLRTVMTYVAVQDGPRRAALRRLGALVPTEILEEFQRFGAPANDDAESTCVEEPFYEPGIAQGGLETHGGRY